MILALDKLKHVELFLPRFSNEENKTLKVCRNLIDKIDGVLSSVLFLLQESMPNTINLVDYRTPFNPGHIPGESKNPCCSLEHYMKFIWFIFQI